MYAVYDSKAELYLQPHFFRARGEAVRAWQTTANNPETNICKYPEDYAMYEIGEYDEDSGTITPYDAKHNIGVAIEFKKSSPVHQELPTPTNGNN